MARKKMTMLAWVQARENYIGWCTECGSRREQTEPDAREYQCEVCGSRTVYGAEEWINEGWLEVVDDESLDAADAQFVADLEET